MEDPANRNYPPALEDTVGPRNMVHSWATTTDDPTVMPRWGKVGKQKIEDAGTLYPKRMETVDEEIRDMSFKWLDKAKADGKPFFLWLNPTRMHVGLSHRKNGLPSALALTSHLKDMSRISSSTVSIRLG